MSDKELLELAAKAAGIEYNDRYGKGFWLGEFYSGREWNPLTDDGDALRLAVKCGIGFIIDTDFVNAYRCGLGRSVVDVCEYYLDHTDDKQSAIRRAIVRAAADIVRAAAAIGEEK